MAEAVRFCLNYLIMKNLLAVLLFFSLSSFDSFKNTDKKPSKWIISETSSLIVNGSTNVNKFSCVILPSPKSDTVLVSNDKSNNIMLSGAIHISVSEFNCDNPIMTRELRKTLKEKEYPYLHIRFVSLKEISTINNQTKVIKGLIEIELAGKIKRFQISYLLNANKNQMILSGTQAINFSDFNLQPPKKMGKLIKAKDKLEVALYLKMELI